MKFPAIKFLACLGLGALLSAPVRADVGVETGPIGKPKSSSPYLKQKVLKKEQVIRHDTKPAESPLKDKVLDREVVVDPSTRPAQSSRVKDVLRAHRVFVKQFTAKRETGRIAISAVLTNIAKTTDENVRFSILHLVGGRWQTVTSGKTTVPAGGRRDLAAELPPTNDRVRLRLDLTLENPYDFSTKSITLREIQASRFLLRYSTNGEWVLAYQRKGEVDTNQLRADAALKQAARLKEFGFDTRISRKTNTGLFTDTEWIRLWVRIPGTQSRIFDSADEAHEFAKAMKSLIHDSVGVWSRVEPE